MGRRYPVKSYQNAMAGSFISTLSLAAMYCTSTCSGTKNNHCRLKPLRDICKDVRMLEESDKEVYRSRKLIEVPATEPIEEEHRTESFRLKVNELLELA